MLRICLQLLVCFTIALRLMMLFNQLRRAWHTERNGLAAEFRRELRRRGLLSSLPDSQGRC